RLVPPNPRFGKRGGREMVVSGASAGRETVRVVPSGVNGATFPSMRTSVARSGRVQTRVVGAKSPRSGEREVAAAERNRELVMVAALMAVVAPSSSYQLKLLRAEPKT